MSIGIFIEILSLCGFLVEVYVFPRYYCYCSCLEGENLMILRINYHQQKKQFPIMNKGG